MLRSLKKLDGYTMSATDGDIGKVTDFLFDDLRWSVRYMVADTRGFQGDGRRVLISPVSFRGIDWSERRFHLDLTISKINGSPGVDLDQPVSRQHELAYHGYYFGYPFYWGGAGAWGAEAYPGSSVEHDPALVPPSTYRAATDDAHLRSAVEVRGYHIEGTDGAVGHVEDFIVDDATWEVRYLVVDTSNWWLGKSVLVAPSWATRVSWEERKVHLALSRQTIKDSPTWDPAREIEREYEARLYDYYGCPIYWNKGDNRSAEASPSSL